MGAQWYTVDTGLFFLLSTDGHFFIVDTNTLQARYDAALDHLHRLYLDK